MKLSVHCIEPHTAARAARHIRRPIQVGSPPTCRPPPRCVQHHVLAAHSRAAHAHSLARSTRAGCKPVRHTPTRRMPTQRRESGPAVAIMRAGMNWWSHNSGPRKAGVVRTTAPARERRHALAWMRSELVSLCQNTSAHCDVRASKDNDATTRVDGRRRSRRDLASAGRIFTEVPSLATPGPPAIRMYNVDARNSKPAPVDGCPVRGSDVRARGDCHPESALGHAPSLLACPQLA